MKLRKIKSMYIVSLVLHLTQSAWKVRYMKYNLLDFNIPLSIRCNIKINSIFEENYMKQTFIVKSFSFRKCYIQKFMDVRLNKNSTISFLLLILVLHIYISFKSRGALSVLILLCNHTFSIHKYYIRVTLKNTEQTFSQTPFRACVIPNQSSLLTPGPGRL